MEGWQEAPSGARWEGHLTVAVRSILGQPRIDLGSTQDRSWVNPGSILGQPRIDPGLTRVWKNVQCFFTPGYLTPCDFLKHFRKIARARAKGRATKVWKSSSIFFTPGYLRPWDFFETFSENVLQKLSKVERSPRRVRCHRRCALNREGVGAFAHRIYKRARFAR